MQYQQVYRQQIRIIYLISTSDCEIVKDAKYFLPGLLIPGLFSRCTMTGHIS